jgi:hypothetical protein
LSLLLVLPPAFDSLRSLRPGKAEATKKERAIKKEKVRLARLRDFDASARQEHLRTITP